MTRNVLVYRISTGILTVMMIVGDVMYFFYYEEMREDFTRIGYPTYLIYPIAIARILGLIAIWSRKIEILKDLAYAGFFYNLLLAVSAVAIAGAPGEFIPALVALVLL